MKQRIFIIVTIISFLLVTSCFHEDNYNDKTSKRDNFELLWKILDEEYCFFEFKDIDWNEVHTKYSDRIVETMTNDALFTVLGEMLAELKDGHVNLYASHDVARYWKWYEDYPDNFDEKIQRNYIGTDYSIASGMKYTILEDNIGYIFYEDFSNGIGEGNLDQVISRMSICDGIIFDVRNNGGGTLTNVEKIASRFFNEKTLVGYMQYKKGKGHNDFSSPLARYIEPSDRLRYQKKVVVLTNRKCFSATNDFVNAMTYAPYATIIGDKTGGGSGLPFSSEIPNGWSVRYSSSPMTNAKREQIEFGIDPNIKVDMSKEDMDKGIDSIIERARTFIKNNN